MHQEDLGAYNVRWLMGVYMKDVRMYGAYMEKLSYKVGGCCPGVARRYLYHKYVVSIQIMIIIDHLKATLFDMKHLDNDQSYNHAFVTIPRNEIINLTPILKSRRSPSAP